MHLFTPFEQEYDHKNSNYATVFILEFKRLEMPQKKWRQHLKRKMVVCYKFTQWARAGDYKGPLPYHLLWFSYMQNHQHIEAFTLRTVPFLLKISRRGPGKEAQSRKSKPEALGARDWCQSTNLVGRSFAVGLSTSPGDFRGLAKQTGWTILGWEEGIGFWHWRT